MLILPTDSCLKPATVAYDETAKAVDVTVTTADDKSDVLFGTGIEQNTDYVLTYDIKGTEGMKIQPLINGIITWQEVGTWGNIGDPVTLTSEWTSYSATVKYAGLGSVTYPFLTFRPKELPEGEETYSYKLANVRLVKKSDAAVYAQATSALNSGEDTIINFKDCTGTTPVGYALTIYSKDTSGNKVIHKWGSTTQKAFRYNVDAPVGTKLYATVTAMSEGNVQSLAIETELGTVQLVKKLAVNLSFKPGDDIVGVAAVENDNTERYMTLYLAQYDKDQKLVGITISDKKTIAANQDTSFEITPDVLDDNTVSIKLMAWDDNMKPYAAAVPYTE